MDGKDPPKALKLTSLINAGSCGILAKTPVSVNKIETANKTEEIRTINDKFSLLFLSN